MFLTKWIHTLEIEANIVPTTREEDAILSQLRESLSEIDYPYNEHKSFASAVARAWALFLTDVRVITLYSSGYSINIFLGLGVGHHTENGVRSGAPRKLLSGRP